MFVLDMPDVPQHYTRVVIAQASQAQTAPKNKERAMGVCFGVNYNPTGQQYSSSGTGLSPEYSAAGYFALYEKRTVNEPPSSNVELIELPKHGKVVYSKYEDGSLKRGYIPDPDYVGDDKIVFKVSVDGEIVKLVYILKVTKEIVGGQIPDDVFCKKTGTQWKISLPNVRVDTVAIRDVLALLGVNANATGVLADNLVRTYLKIDFKSIRPLGRL